MKRSKIKDFFFAGNAVHGESDYGIADNFVRTVEVFASS